jgi:hypothetical protein
MNEQQPGNHPLFVSATPVTLLFVAIPIGAVTAVNENGIQLNITRQQVKDLPSGWHRSPG